MIGKQVIRVLLLILVFGSVALWSQREYRKSQVPSETTPPPAAAAEIPPHAAGVQVVISYFISGPRCASCQKIEALARKTAEEDFAADLASGKVLFRVIDTSAPAANHYVRDYKLSSKTLIVSRREGGKETAWQAMDQVWSLLGDPSAFRAYLAAEVRKQLQ